MTIALDVAAPLRDHHGWLVNSQGRRWISNPNGTGKRLLYDGASSWPFDSYAGIDPIYAQRGQWVHTLTERIDLDDDDLETALNFSDSGVELGIPSDVQAEIADGWRAFRKAHGLTAVHVEAKCVNDEHRVAGTIDRIDRTADGRHVVGDIKTGGSVAKVATAVQLALYAGSLPYDIDTEERGEWGADIDRDTAHAYHYQLTARLRGEAVEWMLVPVTLDVGDRIAEQLTALRYDKTHKSAFGPPIAAPTANAVVEQPAGGDVPSPASPSATLEQFYGNQPDDGPTLDAADHQQIVDTIRAHRVDATLDDQRARYAQLSEKDKAVFAWYCDRNDTDMTDAEQIREAIDAVIAFRDVKVDAAPPKPIAAPRPAPRTPPEEGDEISPAQVEAMGKAYAALPDASRSWVSACGASVRLNPASGGVPSVRRFEILRGLAWLALNGFDNDDTVRAIAALTTLGDDAWRAGVTVAALLGAMTVADATRFALVADIVATGDVAMHWTTDGRCVISPSVLERVA
jgi:hypothetical protein